MLDTRIDNGLVVHAFGEPRRESIGIRDGVIVALGDLGDVSAETVLDVDGAHVFPGIIDTHTHIGFTDPVKELSTEPRSAALGGVTTAMIYFRSGELYDEILPDFLEHGNRQSVIDFGVHLGILHDEHLERLPRYVEQFGIKSIKMYTTYKSGILKAYGVFGQDDGFIFDVLRTVAGMPDLIVNVHCENDDMAERGQRRWLRSGAGDVEQWSNTRPPVAEVEAIRRVGLLAREAGCRLYIPHLSSKRALEAAVAEREAGGKIVVETCPQYLFAGEIQGAGKLAKVNPPVRTAEDAKALWPALASGVIQTVGTDHAALMRADKMQEDVIKARPGFPGIGTLLPALLDGVNRGLLAPRDIARSQQNAAEIFRLNGKGTIGVGYDADLAVVDMSLKRTVSADDLQSISDFSPYEGLTFRGWPVMTIRRGEVIAENREIRTDEGSGRYVRRLQDARRGHHAAAP